MADPKSVTIKDIAASCGVSASTVSKALNGYGDVSADTASFISQMARELGYRPNAVARGLRTSRTFNLGVLCHDDLVSGLKHEYFVGILDAFMRFCGERGYSITFILPRVSSEGLSYLEQSLQRGFDGVAVICASYSDPDVPGLISGPIPIVTVDRVFDGCISVSSDNVGGMRSLVEEIISLGHKRIAYIHGDMTSVTMQRLAAFYRVCAEHDVEVDESLVLPGRYRDVALCRELTGRLLSLDRPPSCILYPDDYSLMGCLGDIQARGLSIPDDISIAGYDGNYYMGLLSPSVTTVRQDTDTIGRIAAEQLISCIEAPRTAFPEHISVPAFLQRGGSVAKVTQ